MTFERMFLDINVCWCYIARMQIHRADLCCIIATEIIHSASNRVGILALARTLHNTCDRQMDTE